MSPALAIILLVVVLLSGAALWVVGRAARNGTSGHESADESVGTTAPIPTTTVFASGFWVCLACRSINRQGAARCYNCRAKADAPAAPQEPRRPARPLVPVMAPPHRTPLADRAPVPAGGLATGSRSGASGIQVNADERAAPRFAGMVRRRATALRQAVAELARPGTSTDGLAEIAETGRRREPWRSDPATWIHPPSPMGSAGHIAMPQPDRPDVLDDRAPAACQHLGLAADRRSRFDFPHPANACHAGQASEDLAMDRVRLTARLRGATSALGVPLDYQAAVCLTAAHGTCARNVPHSELGLRDARPAPAARSGADVGRSEAPALDSDERLDGEPDAGVTASAGTGQRAAIAPRLPERSRQTR